MINYQKQWNFTVIDNANNINIALDSFIRKNVVINTVPLEAVFFFITMTIRNSGDLSEILTDKQIASCQVLSSYGLRPAYFFNIISLQLK